MSYAKVFFKRFAQRAMEGAKSALEPNHLDKAGATFALSKGLTQALYEASCKSALQFASKETGTDDGAAAASFLVEGVTKQGAIELRAGQVLSSPTDQALLKKNMAASGSKGSDSVAVGFIAWMGTNPRKESFKTPG